jgi:8-oxo-dGTP diphosphatase
MSPEPSIHLDVHPHATPPVFCERCATRLSSGTVEGVVRPCCPECGFVVYKDPKVAAGVIVMYEGGVVLLKRGIEPSLGKWVFPGGYVDRGEPTDTAAVREAAEEVGLRVEMEGMVGVFSYRDVPVVLVVYHGKVVGGELQGNSETLDVKSFPVSEIPWDSLGFLSTEEALTQWMAIKDIAR